VPARSTPIIAIDAVAPDPQILRTAAEILHAGGLVAFPTETVYGLGANALDQDAVRKIFDAKGRPAGNPLIVHVNGNAMLRQVVADWPPRAQLLAERFWPGPLTLVLSKGKSVPEIVTAGGMTVAVRSPGHPVALGLIRAAGVPLAAPSANRSGQISPTRAEHVRAGLDGRIDLILDGGPTANGIESTVLDLMTDPPTLLRPGPVSVARLEAVIGPTRKNREASTGPLPSPGLTPRHYAPRTPLELHTSRASLESRAEELRHRGGTIGKMTLGSESIADLAHVAMPVAAEVYAGQLYGVLHQLDALGLDRILIELPPQGDEWVAVHDRLSRAAAT
jgi:L-threonylcarbamoyladenylate synthase